MYNVCVCGCMYVCVYISIYTHIYSVCVCVCVCMCVYACSAGNAGDLGSIPGLGRSPGGEHGNPL